ncbi:hypothetical protein [Williamsia sp. CHRR-6]|uniref:hypothetical protein n=1 Tax=Williamsia sp. CHRR-6 TaxID=2835871 RepID=UPI001BDB3CAE|nr:hypothetical protein [Williamsia sp. CHRR-6]MBT0566075.1 hypothetical protein [Williamsia sp. CHRR-6]
MKKEERAGLGLESRSSRLIFGSGWKEVTPLLHPYSKTISAAIAYVGKDAERYLPLEQGSSIIVDASEIAVRRGLTDPNALYSWHKIGVMVYSLPNLHAKLILAESPNAINPAFLAIGSANVSRSSSSKLKEAILLTDPEETLQDARQALVSWKAQSGQPLSATKIAYLQSIFRADADDPPSGDGTGPDSGGADGDEDDEEAATKDVDEESWPRPTRIYVVPVSPTDDASEEALYIADDLAEQHGVEDGEDAQAGELALTMFWVDDFEDNENWTYPENAHVIAIRTTKSMRIIRTLELDEPGRIIHRYTDKFSSPSRNYYYLLTKISNERRTVADLHEAMNNVGEKINFETGYMRSKVVDALVGIWTDIQYN